MLFVRRFFEVVGVIVIIELKNALCQNLLFVNLLLINCKARNYESRQCSLVDLGYNLCS